MFVEIKYPFETTQRPMNPEKNFDSSSQELKVSINKFMRIFCLCSIFDLAPFLPPANEVCEGYVFTPVVSHSVHGGEGCLVPGGLLRGGGGGLPGGDPPRTATAAGGTHPTGMHSCYQYFSII